jgi:diguanylate cyclase (GGDEF)-like protein
VTDETRSSALGPPSEAQRLEALSGQVESMQTLLVSLLQEVVHAESRLMRTRASEFTAEINQELLPLAPGSRNGLLGRLTQALANARRHQGRCALLCLVITNFKQLDDRHGHELGDRVLQLAARRLAAGVREIDIVSRHGGDGFLVLLSELTEPGDALRVADTLVAAIGVPERVDGIRFTLSARAGAATYPDDGGTFEALFEVATSRAAVAVRGCELACLPPAQGEAGTGDAPSPALAFERARSPRDTEQRLADLREANEHLVLAAIDARELRAAAEQARARQSALLSAVAAELRDPKAPIRIATLMLGRPHAVEPLLPRVQSIVQDRLAQIARLLDAIILDSGGTPPQRQRIDLRELVEDAVNTLRPRCLAREQSLAWQRPAPGFEVMGDAEQLRLVLANLLDNACRYTPERGHLSVGIQATADTVSVTVADNGMGIAPALLPVIFEPFVQDPLALALHGGGLGIGLTVARALVRAHGGQLSVHSAGLRRGTRAVLELPRAGAAVAALPATPPAADAASPPAPTRDAAMATPSC